MCARFLREHRGRVRLHLRSRFQTERRQDGMRGRGRVRERRYVSARRVQEHDGNVQVCVRRNQRIQDQPC